MPHYAYRAIDRAGVQSRGVSEAAHETELFQALRGQGLSLIDCRVKNVSQAVRAQLDLSDQAILCRHLYAMLQAGIPVQVALDDILASGLPRPMMDAVRQVRRSIAAGKNLSSAFAAENGQFDPLFALLLQAGEKTGCLTQALHHLQESLEWKDAFHKKLRKTLSYPMVQMVLAILAVVTLVGVAVPQITQLLAAIGSDVPLYAKILLLAMKVLGVFFVCLIAAAIAAIFIIPVLRRMDDRWAARLDHLVLRLPLVGPVVTKAALTQLAQVFGGMLASGMQVMEALDALPRLTANRALAAELESVRRQVAGGQSLTQSFQRGMRLPAYVVRLLKVGEDGGDIVESMRHIASLYQRESQQAADALLKGTSLLITLTVGLVLVAMVLGVMYPLYQGLSAMVAN